jgi:site-specific DNA-methyltransferase (adenine-specific)
LIRRKTAQQGLFERPVGVEIVRQESAPVDFAPLVHRLPYVFQDPHKLDKKVDPRKLRFGSAIDGKQRGEDRLYRVTEVVSPEVMILDTGLEVRLIGVRQIAGKSEAAVALIRRLTAGQKVALGFDDRKFDDEGRPLVYLYLQDRTLVNEQLLRAHVASGRMRGRTSVARR